jgi:hypothetical protein
LSYTVAFSSGALDGCQAISPSNTPTFYFNYLSSAPSSSVTAGPQMTVNATVNGGASSTPSALTFTTNSAPSSAVALTCQKVGSNYYPGPAVTVSVNSLSANGTPFAVDTTGSAAPPTWLTTGSISGPAVTGNPVTFTVTAASACDSLSAGQSVGVSGTLYYINLQSTGLGSGVTVTDMQIPVSLTVTGAAVSTITPSVTTINLTCVLSSGTWTPLPASTESLTASAANTTFTIDVSGNAVPNWLYLNGGTLPSGAISVGSATTFSVAAVSGCASQPIGSYTYTLKIAGATSGVLQAEIPVTVNFVVSGPTSPLVIIPSPITVTCAKVGSGPYTYVPNYPQTVSVTSTVPGLAFTVGTSAPAWLAMGSPSSGTAGVSASTFTLQAKGTAQSTNCNTGTATSIAIHLTNAPYNDAVFSVALQIVTPSALSATPTSASFTYVKGSGTAGFADVAIGTSILSPYFTVNSASLPSWLQSDPASGSAPQSIRFSSTTVADTLAPGTYTANVTISVAGYGDLIVPVSMLLSNKAAQMTIQGPTTVSLNWTQGEGFPTPTITVLSTDTPIAYTATTGGSLGPVIAAGEQSGLAYSFGTPISVSFSAQAFASATPGSVLTGTVTLTWGSPASTIVVTFDVNVLAPGATMTGLSPSSEAYNQNSFTVALSGTGFVQGLAITQATRVGIVTAPGTPMTFDSAINPTVVNGSNISLQFIYPGSGYTGHIPFTAALATTLGSNSVVIGVCNPVGGVACSIATASQTLYFGGNPIVQAAVSSSSLLQTGSLPNLAPYDMISIFGSNFCPNCASSGSNSILTGSPDPLNLTYPKSLTFTPTAAQASATPPIPGGALTITFQQDSGGTSFTAANAPLLFATNNQINLTVPSSVPLGLVDITVTYTPVGGSAQTSPIYQVTIVQADPGIFTVGADGQGSGAILNLNAILISSGNPAGIRSHSIPGNSDTVTIYMTGLGTPDSTASDASLGTDGSNNLGGLWSSDCVDPGTYLTAFNSVQTGTQLGSLDGTLIVNSGGALNTGRLVPCFLSTDAIAVTFGGQPGTVTYAGWVPDTVAGLYQINVQLPDNGHGNGTQFTTMTSQTPQNITQPAEIPVVVTIPQGSVFTAGPFHTQAGVGIWVAPSLEMAAPTTLTSLKVGTPLTNTYSTGNAVVATGGPGNNSTYTYAVTGGLLPPGLSIVPTGNNGGQITGTPNADTGNPGSNTYSVTVTATDSESVPVTGSVTFTLTVGDGLLLTDTTPTQSTFGAANNAVTTVTAAGGVPSYYYFLNGDSGSYTTNTGIAINETSGVVSTASTTRAGTYSVAVTAQDSGSTPASTTTFPVVVGLEAGPAVVTPATHAGWSSSVAYNTLPVLGGTGSSPTYTYTLDAVSAAFVTQNSSWLSYANGIFTITAQPPVTSSFTVTVTVTDANGSLPADVVAAGTGSTSFAFVIN